MNQKLFLTKKQKQLIIDLEKYIFDYCKKINHKITINYIFNIKYNNYICNNDEIFGFTITYNNKKYNYAIKLINNKFVLDKKNNDLH